MVNFKELSAGLLLFIVAEVISNPLDQRGILEEYGKNHIIKRIQKRSPKPLEVGFASFHSKNSGKQAHPNAIDARLIGYVVDDASNPLNDEVSIANYKTVLLSNFKQAKQLNHQSGKHKHTHNNNKTSDGDTDNLYDDDTNTDRPSDDVPDNLVNIIPISQHLFKIEQPVDDDYPEDTTPQMPSHPRSTLDESGEIPYRDTLGGLGIGFTYGGQGAGHGFFAG